MPTKKPRHDKDASAGRYSGSDQQDVPDYGHADHKQGRAGKAHPEQTRRPWHGPPHDREGQYGYRHDQGAYGRKVDGESPPASQSKNEKDGKAVAPTADGCRPLGRREAGVEGMEEVTAYVLLLASGESSYSTGEVFAAVGERRGPQRQSAAFEAS